MSFKVDEGEIVGLIGPNGSGKSTIFNMISGALKPTSGSVLFKGQEIGGNLPNKICHMGIGRTLNSSPNKEVVDFRKCRRGSYFGQNGKESQAASFDSAKDALEMVGLPTDSRRYFYAGGAGLKNWNLQEHLQLNQNSFWLMKV